MSRKYNEVSIDQEILKKIKTLNKTRNNRMEMSKRLKGYSDKWKIIFFFYNVEAIMIVFTSITLHNKQSELDIFIFSGLFTLYVILLQYYVNELSYNERSLKLHYHQLEIEDCILILKGLVRKVNDPDGKIMEEYKISEYNSVMSDYQSILRNNENHSRIDNVRGTNNRYKLKRSNILKKTFTKKNVLIAKKRKRSSKDLTVDNVFLHINWLVIFSILMYFIIIVKKTL